MSANEPAFPIDGTQFYGLTKREWLAGMAMQGILSSAYASSQYDVGNTSVSVEAVRFSGALIAELERTGEK
jgi:hypothetical protein